MRRSLLASVFMSFLSFNAFGAAEVSSSCNGILHEIGEHMHPEALGNHVHCPLGVAQTLGLLYSIAPEKVREEIASFAGSYDLVKSVTTLNKLLEAAPSTYTPQGKWDEKYYHFTNGLYAILAEQLKLNRAECDPLFAAMGAKLLSVNFAKAEEAAATVNDIANKDTRGKIPEILSPDAFDELTVSVFMHTIYINASWCLQADETSVQFKAKDEHHWVKAFELEATHLQFFQEDGVTLVALPTVEDCHLIIRHAKEVTPVTEDEITRVLDQKTKYVQSFKAPYVSMKQELDLMQMLIQHMPTTLGKSFFTKLVEEPLKIGKYIQKVTFDMTNKGVEAAAVTAMVCLEESCMMPKEGPRITIDSPFSFALIKYLDGYDYLLFQGQVVDFDVLKRES